MNIFSMDLLGMPPDRGIDFAIAMESKTKNIFILPLGWSLLS